MYMRPVVRLKWNLGGARFVRHEKYVKNDNVDICTANCLRMSQRLSGVLIVLTMYCTSAMP